jgi:hypothetical protein
MKTKKAKTTVKEDLPLIPQPVAVGKAKSGMVIVILDDMTVIIGNVM